MFPALLDLPHGDHREEPREENERQRERRERGRRDRPLDPRRTVHAPLPRHERIRHRGHDDHVALDVHTDVHEHRRNHDAGDRPGPPEGHEQDGDDEPPDHERPEQDGVPPEHELVQERVISYSQLVPDGEVLGEREVRVEEPKGQEHRPEELEVLLLDVPLQAVDAPEDRHDHDERPDPGEDRSHDEVGPEDRRVPTIGWTVMAKTHETTVWTETATGMTTMAMIPIPRSSRIRCTCDPTQRSANHPYTRRRMRPIVGESRRRARSGTSGR